MIDLDLINVLAKDDCGHAKNIGKTCNNNIPVPLMSQYVIATADHQRSPHKQDSDFAERNVFQGPGVEQNKEHTCGKQNPNYRVVGINED